MDTPRRYRVGETERLEEAMSMGRFDLSDDESLEFVGRLMVGQIRAMRYLAGQLDELKATLD